MKTPEINCIIIHGSPRDKTFWTPIGDPKRWQTWLKHELETRGIKTFVPSMPTPWQPTYKKWKVEFEKFPLNENSILVGHSAGGAFLVRWLGENKQIVKKLILVSPGKKIGNYPNAIHNKDLYDFKVNPLVKYAAKEIVIFTSPEEPAHRQENIALYRKILSAKVISLPGRGHYVYKDLGTNEFPELLDVIVN
jgi:predicted alpha/beta hydrolase family esterase